MCVYMGKYVPSPYKGLKIAFGNKKMWDLFSKCFNLKNKLFCQIDLNGQSKIIPHLPKSINPVTKYLNLKVIQNLAFKKSDYQEYAKAKNETRKAL